MLMSAAVLQVTETNGTNEWTNTYDAGVVSVR